MTAPRQPKADQSRLKVAVLGIGQMGLVSAGILAGPEARPSPSGAAQAPRVALWGRSADEAGRLLQTRCSPKLADFRLPDRVEVNLKLASAIQGASLVVSAIPVQFVRDVWHQVRPLIGPEVAVLSVAKGIETPSLLRVSQVIADVLMDDPDAKPRSIGCLSGPTIAAELARCLPAAMIAASEDEAFAKRVQGLFTTSWLRVYTNTDLIGVELAGAAKNVVAIAAGIVDGLGAGNNAKSALLARGLAEISRLGVAMGAARETFFGIAGVGDLATSCFSREGRNRSCGEALGRGMALSDFLAKTPFVVEGVATCKAVVALARVHGVEMPICEAVHAVLFDGVDPIEAIGKLMTRDAKPERVG